MKILNTKTGDCLEKNINDLRLYIKSISIQILIVKYQIFYFITI